MGVGGGGGLILERWGVLFYIAIIIFNLGGGDEGNTLNPPLVFMHLSGNINQTSNQFVCKMFFHFACY